METVLDFAEFGKYFACAFMCEDDNIGSDDECSKDFFTKYGEIPFRYNDEDYYILLIPHDHSLEIHKKDDEEFEEYSDFKLVL